MQGNEHNDGHTITLQELVDRANTGRITEVRHIVADGTTYRGSLSRIHQRSDGFIQIEFEKVQKMYARFMSWISTENRSVTLGSEHNVLLRQSGAIHIDLHHAGAVVLSQNHIAQAKERCEELELAFA